MHGADAVEADAGVGEPRVADAVRRLVVDERPVRREDGSEPDPASVLGDLEEVGAHQGFAAGEEHGGNLVGGEVVHEPHRLVGRQLAGVFLVPRVRVAVDAAQIASLRAVPHDDGLLVVGIVEEVGGTPGGGSPVSQRISGCHRAVQKA